jgi:DNA primase
MVSQRIPEEIVQEVLLRTDVVDVVGDYVLLKKTGENYKGLCPFHNEKTPSFTVSPAKGFFYCFGCQAKGNAAGFLMQQASLTFPEAIQMLASRYGVHVPETGAAQKSNKHQPLYDLLRAATTFFHDSLRRDPAGEAGRAFCRQRQISSDLAARFELGHAPQAWEALRQAMLQQGFTEELLIQGGLVVERHEPQRRVYDRFRNRVVFPIHDHAGRPVAFGARMLDESADRKGPKYLNSPETPIFHKGQTLYGLHLARQAVRQHERVIIVEGYTDVLACHRQGVPHVVGTLGTALTDRHVGQLRGAVKEAVLVFDGDDAGGKAAKRSIGLFLDAGVRVRIATLPASDDPDSFLRTHTGEAFLGCVENAMTFPAFLVARAQHGSALQTPAGRGDFVERIAPLLRKVGNQVERWGHLVFLAEKLGVPPQDLRRQLFARTSAHRSPAPQRQAEGLPSRPATKRFPEEYDLVHLLYHRPELLSRTDAHMTAADFMDADLGSVYSLLLKFAPHGEDERWSQKLHEEASDGQDVILAQIAVQSLPPASTGDARVMQDCLEKMRQRRYKLQLQQVKQRLAAESDEAERQRLLEQATLLAKERQPAVL